VLLRASQRDSDRDSDRFSSPDGRLSGLHVAPDSEWQLRGSNELCAVTLPGPKFNSEELSLGPVDIDPALGWWVLTRYQ
jgi:hypothetical protein